MESFFGTLKTEFVHRCDYPDRDAARRDLFAYIEGYYNRQRIHSAEPRRDFRRLQLLRGWSHDEASSPVFS